LDEVALKQIKQQLAQADALLARKQAILRALGTQGALEQHPALGSQILGAQEMSLLEDLYRPFRKAQQTKASLARSSGFGALGDLVWQWRNEPGVGRKVDDAVSTLERSGKSRKELVQGCRQPNIT